MKGCDIVFHCAALTDLKQPWEEFYRSNVLGTKNILEAALMAGVPKIIHISSEASFVTGLGSPIQNISETTPLPNPEEQILLFYPRSKNMAERVCEEYHDKLNIVILRPRFIWGYGDTVVLPEILAASRSFLGFSWIGGAEYLTSICNISNIVYAMILAADKGTPGEAYFISDNEILTQKAFMSSLFQTQSIDPSSFGNLPLFLAQGISWLGVIPQISSTSLSLMGQEITVSNAKAKRELGYEPIVNLEEGLEELRQEFLTKSQPT
jgi:nucleoside-diphosphate-sugar epimerase